MSLARSFHSSHWPHIQSATRTYSLPVVATIVGVAMLSAFYLGTLVIRQNLKDQAERICSTLTFEDGHSEPGCWYELPLEAL